MAGAAFRDAQSAALLTISLLPDGAAFNVLCFGDVHDELFPAAKPKTAATAAAAASFLSGLRPVWGSTELWRPLRCFELLPAPTGAPRAVILLSDGLPADPARALQIAARARGTRLFVLGVGPTPARHFLRSLARVSGGAAEILDSSRKSRWRSVVQQQLDRAAQPCLTSVAVSWQQFDSNAPPPVQAPRRIAAVFNGSRLVVYGFVPHCTQATLTAEVSIRSLTFRSIHFL